MRALLLLTTIAVLAACGTRGSEAAERRADTVARRDSIAGVAAATMGEPNVIALLEMTHAADSALGSLGAAKGSATEIKEFGRMISREHHALRKDASDLAAQLGLATETPRVPPDEPPAEMRDSVLASPSSAAWDRLYLDYAIAMHRSAIENTARALAATHRPEVKTFIEKSVPILQKHLDKAESLHKALSGRQQPPKPSKPAKQDSAGKKR